jgi:hypothetical protein
MLELRSDYKSIIIDYILVNKLPSLVTDMVITIIFTLTSLVSSEI